MDDVFEKEDGLSLITEKPYALQDLKNYLSESCLAKRCSYIMTLEEDDFRVEQICKFFLNHLEEELNLDELTTMIVFACITYYIQPTPINLEWREHLVLTTFQYVDTLMPMHIHVAAKKLWDNLKTEERGIDFVFNVLNLCYLMSTANETGKAVAIVLIWTIICEVSETEYQMFTFRPFHSLIDMLDEVDDDKLLDEDTTKIVYVLVRCVGFLISSIVYADNSIFKENGYTEFFSYDKTIIQKLLKWASHLSEVLKVGVHNAANNWDLSMLIKEYVNANIIGVLNDKLCEYRDPMEDENDI